MALMTNVTSITIHGESAITVDGATKTAVTMAATINKNGHSSTNMTIVSQQLYNENKEACRKDEDEFETLVRSIEDNGIDSLIATA